MKIDATFTGMGMDINVHDQWAVESPGAIVDRTKEHLGDSDRIITAARRLIFRGIDDVAAGRAPPGVTTAACGPDTIDAVGPTPIEMLEQDRPSVLRQAIQAVRKGGTVSVPGVYGGLLDKVPFGAA